MAGHSKWSQIKHKKAILDKKRGQAFTRVIKEITVAARAGGGDPDSNAKLRLLIEKAKEINMPLDNITRAIKRGTGELPGVNYEPIVYEGYGPYGIAVIIETLTDNKNRTVAELRHAFSGKGGNLAETGAVAWMFEKLGVIDLKSTVDENQLLEKLIDFDIQDIKKDTDFVSIYCDPKSLEQIKEVLKNQNFAIERAEVEQVAKNKLILDTDQANKAIEFLESLQDLDDVQDVYTNLA